MSSKKKMDHKTKVRILLGAIGLTIVVLIYQVAHWFEVLKEVQDPDSPNARAAHPYHGPTQAEIDEDDRFFKQSPVSPLPLQSKPAAVLPTTHADTPSKPAPPAAAVAK